MARVMKWNPKPDGFVMPELPDLTVKLNQMKYLNYCMDKGGHAAFFTALKNVVEAIGANEFSKRPDVGIAPVYVLLRNTQKMHLFTWIKICHALGFEFNIGGGLQAPYFTMRKDVAG